MVKNSTSKRLLGFYAPNILNGLLITLGELKALGKITRLIVLFKAKFIDLDIPLIIPLTSLSGVGKYLLLYPFN